MREETTSVGKFEVDLILEQTELTPCRALRKVHRVDTHGSYIARDSRELFDTRRYRCAVCIFEVDLSGVLHVRQKKQSCRWI